MCYNVIDSNVYKYNNREVDYMPDANKLLEMAIKEVDLIKSGETFIVKDLFKGYEWKRIPRNDRLLLGTLFLNYVNTTKCKIKAIEKTSSNQQLYKKSIDRIVQ